MFKERHLKIRKFVFFNSVSNTSIGCMGTKQLQGLAYGCEYAQILKNAAKVNHVES